MTQADIDVALAIKGTIALDQALTAQIYSRAHTGKQVTKKLINGGPAQRRNKARFLGIIQEDDSVVLSALQSARNFFTHPPSGPRPTFDATEINGRLGLLPGFGEVDNRQLVRGGRGGAEDEAGEKVRAL